MAWTIEYAETAKKQLRKLDKLTARRIVGFRIKDSLTSALLAAKIRANWAKL